MPLHGLIKFVCLALSSFILQLEQFVAHTLQTALSADSMANTHPISVPVKNPSQITEIFDSISYDKVRSYNTWVTSCDKILQRVLHEDVGG